MGLDPEHGGRGREPPGLCLLQPRLTHPQPPLPPLHPTLWRCQRLGPCPPARPDLQRMTWSQRFDSVETAVNDDLYLEFYINTCITTLLNVLRLMILIYQYNFLYGLDLYTVVAVFIVCTGI